MDRLTNRRADGSVETTGMEYCEIHMAVVPSSRGNDKYDVRLAEYEDTGITPEEIAQLQQRVRDLENKEHMRQNLCSASCCDVAVQLEDTQAEAAAMRNALDSVYPLIAGRVIQLQKSGEIMAMEEWNAECIRILQALAPEAGKELLEELRRLQDENAELLKQGNE